MSNNSEFTIVVATDFSPPAGLAVDQALAIATLHDGSAVHMVYVHGDGWVPNSTAGRLAREASAEEAMGELQRNAAEHIAKIPSTLDRSRIRRVVTHLRGGSAATSIAQFAADLDADLVVVGSHGHRGLEHFFLGSVAERVSHLARCPVWIVRPKEHAAAGRVPEIEPTCPQCLVARRESGGAQLWCAHHSEHHLRAQGYAYTSDGVYSAATSSYASTPGT